VRFSAGIFVTTLAISGCALQDERRDYWENAPTSIICEQIRENLNGRNRNLRVTKEMFNIISERGEDCEKVLKSDSDIRLDIK